MLLRVSVRQQDGYLESTVSQRTGMREDRYVTKLEERGSIGGTWLAVSAYRVQFARLR